MKEGLFATTTVSFIESFRLAFAFLIHLGESSFPSQPELAHTLLRRHVRSSVLHLTVCFLLIIKNPLGFMDLRWYKSVLQIRCCHSIVSNPLNYL